MNAADVVCLCIAAASFGALFTGMWWEAQYRKLERSFVLVGDIWEYLGSPDDTENPRLPQKLGCYVVVKPNVNTEAGADSWLMRNEINKRELYMHHRMRVAGSWRLCMRDGVPKRRAR
jgi:hypothetical protein